MTTNLEKYLGLKLFIQEELNPLKITYLKEKALNISEIVGFDANEYFVYIHRLSVQICNDEYFASSIKLSERLKELEITFDVNPKQIRKKQILFYNAQASIKIQEGIGIRQYYGDTQLKIIYPGTLLDVRYSFDTELIIYVSKNLKRTDHRKIKIIAQGYPTASFYSHIRKNTEYHETKIDLRLDKDANLHLKYLTDEEKLQIKELLLLTKNEGIDVDAIALLSTISSFLNIIDQFIGISGKLPSKHTVQSKQENGKLIIFQDDTPVKNIDARQVKLNHFDQIRFEALQERVDLLWKQYNGIYSVLPTASDDERIRLEQKMDKFRKDLCRDFQEMIKIFEATLDLRLTDIYTIHSVCESHLK
jgi:hypothetical protein